MSVAPPMALIAELTHRCPLQCPYCSNPLMLEGASDELPTEVWQSVLDQAAALGVLQLHLTGGEPLARPDLPVLVAHAAKLGLYTNLITSGVLLDAARMQALQHAGLDHVQLSFQHADPIESDRIGNMSGAYGRKIEAARLVRMAGLPLTANFVVHRQNVASIPEMIALAAELGAERVEIAHVQYYGWALQNRTALLPSRSELDTATRSVLAARSRFRDVLRIDYVTPDYHARRPKPCMGGWARRIINIGPTGKALPCHAAETIRTLEFPSVRAQSLAAIWFDDPAFNRYRGTDWMPDLCRSCDRREIDWGGCRCQALELAGDAGQTDPVCDRSPVHDRLQEAVKRHGDVPPAFVFRRKGRAEPML